ncbi:hypothetical protein [uncultured Oscillibacter sp.]|uniref:hypothetical protein n=1 Tax=uncultured Oscillibacter sp. TaxID=876091 RepID=UPI0025FC6A57|nr:hypothetical protein [uncultured Oscillibacter sp.]
MDEVVLQDIVRSKSGNAGGKIAPVKQQHDAKADPGQSGQPDMLYRGEERQAAKDQEDGLSQDITIGADNVLLIGAADVKAPEDQERAKLQADRQQKILSRIFPDIIQPF